MNYIIPTNTKKGQLIFGFLRGIDLMILLAGVAITFLIAFIIGNANSLLAIIIIIIPTLVAGTLVFPFPNYHNVLQFVTNVIVFIIRRRRYYWKGWCVRNADEIK